MKVLIAAFDLFGVVGGGQTYYQSIIRRNPGIEFHYFRWHEPRHRTLPANVRAHDYVVFHDGKDWEGRFDLEVPAWAFGLFLPAQNMAKSVAGQQFDIVEFPDYYQFGFFLRPALQHFGVRFGQIVISMHGAISTAFELNWWGNGEPIPWLRYIEQQQYDAADQRYFISEFYRDEWRSKSALPAHYLDPLHFFDIPQSVSCKPRAERPILRFIGRIEKRKGPDLALNLAWWLPHSLYERLELIGPDCCNDAGESATPIVNEMIRARNLPAVLLSSQSQSELADGFADRSVTLLPSRYDSLNLIALESLFAGCPTVVGSGAGVCRYLHDRFPEIPFVRFDVEDFQSALASVEQLLSDYDNCRSQLAAALKRVNATAGGMTLAEIYRGRPQHDQSAAHLAERWHGILARMLRDAPTSTHRVAA